MLRKFQIHLLGCFIFVWIIRPVQAQEKIHISGMVTDQNHQPLSYAGVYISGSSIGTSTNAKGRYSLELSPGEYSIVCRYLGYEKQQKRLVVDQEPQEVDFMLRTLPLEINEVIVRGGEDLATAIIRKAIQKRPFYENQLKAFRCQVYIKGQVRLADAPARVLGQKMDYKAGGIDTAHGGVIFLSESLSNINFLAPHHFRQEVISSRQSGGGLGFDFPIFLDFYRNNLALGSRQFTPRGFISPISDGALHYYAYHLAGTFLEDGQTVYKIRVTPKRKQEPLFSGFINIMDSSWKIHSLDLIATRNQQLQLIDSLEIRQIHGPVTDSIWRIRNQSIISTFNQFGFKLKGIFINVYDDYDLHPVFAKGFFDSKVVLGYDSLADRRTAAYWDSVRLVPLQAEESQNFRERDSMTLAQKDSLGSKHYTDSLNRRSFSDDLMDILWRGFTRVSYGPKGVTMYWAPTIKRLSYNTVEGWVTKADLSFYSHRPSGAFWSVSPTFRYGWSNHHFNSSVQLNYRPKPEFGTDWTLSGGKRVSQFNQDNPIYPLANSLHTLLATENYMKIYENYFVHLDLNHRYVYGFNWQVSLVYEDRLPLYNTTDFILLKTTHKQFTPNHPAGLAGIPFIHHQALIAALTLSYQPGQRYIQYPWGKTSIGSKAPTLSLGYTRGIPDLLGSDIDYDKWIAGVRQDVNLHLLGILKYKMELGGFIRAKSVSIPDLKHFDGNLTFYNTRYMSSFQLPPYYEYSNDAPFYTTLFVEYHLNGLLTNKIPLFNQLHWNIEFGTNSFYTDQSSYYGEFFGGLENIFKVFRVDVVTGFYNGSHTHVSIRVGLDGLLGNSLRISRKPDAGYSHSDNP